mmetsp:Transcript_32086/g.96381  ORF Transcript_32086/g.96381 Transcript_32086/m.96381 type:complete len:131 (-) Transcript_32086:190-582(-)
MITAEHGAIECAKFLLANGAQVDLCGRDGPETALHVASNVCNTDGIKLIDLLIDAGADVNARGQHGVASNYSEWTPLGTFLHTCPFPATFDASAVLGSFLRAGADVDAVAGYPGERLSAEHQLYREDSAA